MIRSTCNRTNGLYRNVISYAAVLSVLLGALSCSTTHFRESADKEVYKIVEDKASDVPNMEPKFTIEPAPPPGLEGLPKVAEKDDALGELADSEVGASIISLEKALDLAVKHNRSYQNQKESLYLSVLNLTLTRHQYTPIFSGGASSSYDRSTNDVYELSTTAAMAQAAPDMVNQIGGLVGTPAALLSRYSSLVEEAVAVSELDQPDLNIRDERSVSGQTNAGVDLLLKGGGRIAVDITSNFLRFLTGDSRVSTNSALIATFTQPILRGAGSKVAAERLTQAERDVLYDLRSYTHYRKTFSVQVASSYYSVLQQRDELNNNYLSYLAFKESAERDRAFVAEGREKTSDLRRVEQAELNAKNGWNDSISQYKQSLDEFKIMLGLPVDSSLALDLGELVRLKEQGLVEWRISSDDAIKVALNSRLDLYNTKDAVEDASRQVEVQKNSLLPDLDLNIDAQVDSKPGDRFQELDFQRTKAGVGIDLELPLDRKSERNEYRSALIQYERAKRNLELGIDDIKLEVRDAWRSLDQARQTYDIRQIGVRINEDRVAEQSLLSELGRGNALNLVDAQNDLTSARNELTNALVAHTIARLEFWRDMGILFIKENGQWEDVSDDIES